MACTNIWYPPGNESISHHWKRKIIDSKVPWEAIFPLSLEPRPFGGTNKYQPQQQQWHLTPPEDEQLEPEVMMGLGSDDFRLPRGVCNLRWTSRSSSGVYCFLRIWLQFLRFVGSSTVPAKTAVPESKNQLTIPTLNYPVVRKWSDPGKSLWPFRDG